MKIKTFVGKDKREAKRAAARKLKLYRPAASTVCRTCGDEFSPSGWCVKCRATLEAYQLADAAKAAKMPMVTVRVRRAPCPK